MHLSYPTVTFGSSQGIYHVFNTVYCVPNPLIGAAQQTIELLRRVIITLHIRIYKNGGETEAFIFN